MTLAAVAGIVLATIMFHYVASQWHSLVVKPPAAHHWVPPKDGPPNPTAPNPDDRPQPYHQGIP